MVQKGYAKELLKEKVASMKQLDRIEFKQDVSIKENTCNDLYINYGIYSIMAYILLCNSIIIAVLSKFSLEDNFKLKLGMLSILFIFFGFILFIISLCFFVLSFINRIK